jgi:serine/threonine protein phosphatase 1
VPTPGRTFAIGDIHGERAALDRLLGRLPALTTGDTLVFLGDYVDRGPDSRGVVDTVRALRAGSPAKVITLRGNHEDMWLECWRSPNLGFLLPRGNGCVNMFRSYIGGAPLAEGEDLELDELEHLFAVRSWFPADVHEFMNSTDHWYEDEHAIYVHAGLQGEDDDWKHPSQSSPKHLMWMREPDFFSGYRGKRLVFGHTPTRDLEPPADGVWRRGDLVGIDTGAGKGGYLSAIELPSLVVYDSRP